MSTRKAASQWNNMALHCSVHKQQTSASLESDSFTVTFSLFSFCAHFRLVVGHRRNKRKAIWSASCFLFFAHLWRVIKPWALFTVRKIFPIFITKFTSFLLFGSWLILGVYSRSFRKTLQHSSVNKEILLSI